MLRSLAPAGTAKGSAQGILRAAYDLSNVGEESVSVGFDGKREYIASIQVQGHTHLLQGASGGCTQMFWD